MNFILPDWPAPQGVKSLITTRVGGVSLPPFESFNLGSHVGDDSLHVSENRKRLIDVLPSEPKWLNQTHSTCVVDLDKAESFEGDAAFTRAPRIVCAVLTADCLPILLAGKGCVGALHAGWRGLAAGIVESTVEAMQEAELIAYLGPAIGQDAFEVGEEVYDAFPLESFAFKQGNPGKWHADLYSIARARLEKLGIKKVYGGAYCTLGESSRFFSYRRDGRTGRMGSLIWLEED